MSEAAADKAVLDRVLTLEIARVTERAAVAAARLRGRGDEKAADQAAVDAMRSELNELAIDGVIVIGEGERDEAPMLYIGEEVGTRKGPEGRHRPRPAGRHDDLRQEPAELAGGDRHGRDAAACSTRRTSTWRRSPSARAIRTGVVDLDRSPEENLQALADAKGVPVAEITACILDRPRHAQLIAAVREAGAAIRLIGDGDVAGVIHTTDPEETGIDIYMGIGGAPGGRPRRGGAALHRRTDAGPAAAQHQREARCAPRRWASPTPTRSTPPRRWPRAT